MKIVIESVGILRADGLEDGTTLELAPGTAISDLLAEHNVSMTHLRYILAIVNGDEQKQSYVLQDNDRVSFFLPVGGG